MDNALGYEPGDGSSILSGGSSFLLGYSLVWSKATVFEIVITGSNPVTSASFRIGSANFKLNFLVV